MQTSDTQLSQLLKEQGLLKESELKDIATVAKNAGTSIYDVLIDKDIMSDETIGQTVAQSLGYPFVVLAKTAINDDLLHITPEKVAKRLKVVAFARDASSLKMAMANPGDKAIIDAFIRKTNCTVIPYFATEKDIHHALRMFRKVP